MADVILKELKDEELSAINGGISSGFAQKLENTAKIAGAVGTAAAKSVFGEEKVDAVRSLIGKE